MKLSRRQWMSGASASMAFAGLAHAQSSHRDAIQADPYRSEVFGYGPLKRDPLGLFDLPEGFSYEVLSRFGERMDDGLLTPGKIDGMACFSTADRKIAIVRNHEIKTEHEHLSAFGPDGALARLNAADVYDHYVDGRPLGGGTTTLIYDPAARRVLSRRLSLAGTNHNCAGGATPWGSWLSCEETVLRAGEEGAGKDHGWVFEVPANGPGLAPPLPIAAMGRFKHEAVAVDPRTGVLYMTEDESDGEGLFYRFLPNDRTNLHAGGRLQALAMRSDFGGDTRNWNGSAWAVGDRRRVSWIDIDGADNPHNDIHDRGHAAGAAWFARGEGIHAGAGEFYFTCTHGGPNKLGQVMRYRPSLFEGQPNEADAPGRLELFAQPDDATVLQMPDNLTVAPWGHLVICEDKSDGVNYLRGMTPDGRVYTLGRNPTPDPETPDESTELAGPCFSPDGRTLFLNIFDPGATLAITGPWASFAY